MKRKRIDLHDHSLDDADDYLMGEILEAGIEIHCSLEIIHGFNRGTVLQKFIRHEFPKKYFKYLKSNKIEIEVEWFEKGRTIIHVNSCNN